MPSTIGKLPSPNLSLIFERLDKSAQYRCALVCKAWKGTALPMIWKEMSSVMPLLHLLGKLEIVPSLGGGNHAEYVYSSMPTIKSWARFSTVAQYVRALEYSDIHDLHPRCGGEAISIQLGLQLFAALSARPGNNLLPNLRRLSYSCGGRGAIWLSPFLHGSLDSLVLEIHPSASLHTSPLLLNALSLRATGLRQLQISDGQSLGTESQQVVVSAFEALSKLQHICLPTHYYTPKIFEVLAKHPTIQTITTLPGRPNPTFAISSSNLGPCAGFRSTRFINLVEPAVASRFVHRLSSPSQITAVELSFDFSTVNEDIDLISRKCPHLQHFKVTIGNAPETHSSYRFDEAMVSLSRCSELQSIEVIGSRVVTVSEDSASLAGLRWKDLQRLILNPVPTCDISRQEPQGAGISYETLRNLVESCKVLSHVGVFMGQSSRVIPYKAVQSASLRTLDVGISTAPRRNVVQGLLGLSLLDLDIIVYNGQPISISKLEWENITLELARWAMVYQSIHAVRIVMLENNRQAQLLQNHVAFLETWYKKRYSSP